MKYFPYICTMKNLTLSAWQKGDLVKLNDEKFRLISDAYEKDSEIVIDTDNGDTISYLILIKDAILLEDIYGNKNIKIYNYGTRIKR